MHLARLQVRLNLDSSNYATAKAVEGVNAFLKAANPFAILLFAFMFVYV